MDAVSDISTTESVCSSNCTVESASDVNSCTSQLSDVENRPFPWPTKEISIVEDVDFGSLAKNYGPPLIICFYRDVCGNPVTRISEFCDVPLGEAVRALNAQHEHTQYTNLLVRFDSCREEDVAAFLPVLRLLLFRCRINFTMPEWERCVLLMSDYKFANEVVEIMAEFTNKIFELNIGSVQQIKEQRHRTVSVIEHPVFNGVESFEFNGCGMAHTEQDLQVAKNLVKCFPNLKIVAFREVCFEPVMTSVIRFASLVKSTFMARPGKEDDCVEFVNERYGTCLVVYDSRRVYHTPF